MQDTIDLDLLIVGFRESPEIFREFCGSRRPVDDTHAVVQRAFRHRRHGEFGPRRELARRAQPRLGRLGREGREVEETFRFVCPNNPNVRQKAVRRLRELLTRYEFTGVFLDKIRFPSPANGIDEMLSCFCGHCRDAASAC